MPQSASEHATGRAAGPTAAGNRALAGAAYGEVQPRHTEATERMRDPSLTIRLPPTLGAGKAPDVQLARDPALIEADVDSATTVQQLTGLLREAEKARAGATRRILPSGSGHADRYTGLVERIEHAIIDKLYTDVGGLGGIEQPHIVINAFAMKGSGDLVLARKTAEILQASVANLEVVIISNEVAKMKKLAPSYTTRIFPNDSALPERFQAPLLYVHVGGKAGSKGSYGTLGIDESVPLFKILEYGFSSPTDKATEVVSLGLSENELGVLLDEDLTERSAANQPAAELAALEDRDKLAKIVGRSNPTRRDCEAYLKKTSMYFGYAHSPWSLTQFFDVILAREIDVGTKPDIDILLPRSPTRTVASRRRA